MKRGNKGLKQMRERWFSLEVNTLSYYKNNRQTTPLGFISLSQVSAVTPRKDAEEGLFDIKMENEGDKEGRTYYLRARTKQELEEWIGIINESKAFYERGGLPLVSGGGGGGGGGSSVAGGGGGGGGGGGSGVGGDLKLQLQQKGREIEALSRSLQLTRNLLEKEKKRSQMILEVERAEANKLREAQQKTAQELTETKAQLAETEKQLVGIKGLVVK